MRERKPYPNISDEELDRRAEEALKRMLAKQDQKVQGHTGGQNHQGGGGQGGQGGQGGPGGGGNPGGGGQNRHRHRRKPRR